MNMQLAPSERNLVKNLRRAVLYSERGDPVKDAIDDDDLIYGVSLLLEFLDVNHPGWDKPEKKAPTP